MLQATREEQNPLLKPNVANPWQEHAVFNGNVIKDANGVYHMVYRASTNVTKYHDKELMVSTVGYASSKDGIYWENTKQLIAPELDWEFYGCEDPRMTKINDTYYIFYTGLSSWPPNAPGIKVGVAITKDFITIEEKHLVTPFNAKAMVLLPQKVNGKYAVIVSVNTDMPPSQVAVAYLDTLEQLWDIEFWTYWYRDLEKYVIPLQRMSSDQVEVGAVPILTEKGWLFVYSYIQNYYNETARVFGIEAVTLDTQDLQKITSSTLGPIMVPEKEYELHGVIPNIIFPSGAIIENNQLTVYYGACDGIICSAKLALDDLYTHMQTKQVIPFKLKKFAFNPILYPKPEHAWEAQAVFNAAAVYDADQFHILYRTQSSDNTSFMGYANSNDGYHIHERYIEPVYYPRADFERKKKDGVGSGCEDPRLMKVDGKYYMLYTAYDGINVPRVAMTSISVDDFLHKKWERWEQPVLISPPNVDDKDACIFPEKVNGKYVIMHRINHEMVMDFVDDLHWFDGRQNFLDIKATIAARKDFWDGAKCGISAPPIKTEAGWLLSYHGISVFDHNYRVGFLLLDLNDPSKIISRTRMPVMEPEFRYEKEGVVHNVCFPCGMAVKDDELFVYYGGADKVLCVATCKMNALIDYMKEGIEN
jgi:beta-1,2-mannobiose phosphorylase / 1,2-beta-oligomannan phosphorylase